MRCHPLAHKNLRSVAIPLLQEGIGEVQPVTLLSPLSPSKKGANPLWQAVLSPCHPFFDFLEFEGRYVQTKQMVAGYYGVDERTIERLLISNEDELKHNGYFLCKGNSLKEFKLRFSGDIDVAHKTVSLGLFDFYCNCYH